MGSSKSLIFVYLKKNIFYYIMLNILKNIYFEVCFYIKMIKICFQQNSIIKYNNIKDIIFNTMMKHFDYCFKIVNSGIGKYLIIKNKDTGETYTSLNFGSYDYMGMSNIILPNERDYLIHLYHKYQIQSL